MPGRDDPQARAPAGRDAVPERLGDFLLLERLGAGGMGVVFVARQQSLQRDVALKLILPEHLYFPEARERFRREVEAVAKLNHPGVVPVYYVGEEQGLPFFTMELVEGCSLATLIEGFRERTPDGLSGADLRQAIVGHARRFRESSASDDGAPAFAGTWVQACCRLVLQVAEALQHAHDRGVVHRDVKPSNVIVTPSGRAMLLDFGLASDEHSSRITRTGAHLGSLAYMPPERVSGGLSGAEVRGDVYSLGVSLYELLTLRLPFEGKTVQELFHAITAGACAPLRDRNPAVPWDAATVCATAMERDPARRYASAGALARDLRNLLELRPIEARPPRAGLRVRRWVQRHPTTSVAAGLGFLLLVVAPGAAWWRIKRERDAALEELQARESMLAFLIDVIDAADPEATGAAGQRSLQEVVEEGTQRIREELKDYPEVRADVLLNLASIQQKLGRPRDAAEMSEEAVQLARAVYGADGAKTLACERSLASNLVSLGEFDRAEALFRHVRKIAGEQGAASGQKVNVVDLDIAAALVIQHRFAEAGAILERLEAEADAPSRQEMPERVSALTVMAEVDKGLGRFEQAEARLKQAVDLATQAWGRKHTSVARALQNLAALYVDEGRGELAAPWLEEALAIRTETGAKESIEDARLAHNLGSAYNKAGNSELALEQFQRSLALTRRFAGDSAPTARAASGVGAMLFKLGRIDEAEISLRESLALSRRFIARQGMAAIEAPLWLARCRAQRGDFEEAARLWQEVLDCLHDEIGLPAPLLAKFEGEFADVLTHLGRTEEAAGHRERAEQLGAGG